MYLEFEYSGCQAAKALAMHHYSMERKNSLVVMQVV
jgi:hypothetical protein